MPAVDRRVSAAAAVLQQELGRAMRTHAFTRAIAACYNGEHALHAALLPTAALVFKRHCVRPRTPWDMVKLRLMIFLTVDTLKWAYPDDGGRERGAFADGLRDSHRMCSRADVSEGQDKPVGHLVRVGAGPPVHVRDSHEPQARPLAAVVCR